MKKIAIILSILLLFCACTKQPKADIYEFSKRLNSQLSEEIIVASEFYSLDDEYYFFPSSSFMIALTTDEKSAVKKCEITVSKSQSEEINAEKIYNVFSAMCSVLTNESPEKINEYLSSNGLNESVIGFSDFTLKFENEKYEYFIYSNCEAVTLLCEIKN